jgi:hypothetical protein
VSHGQRNVLIGLAVAVAAVVIALGVVALSRSGSATALKGPAAAAATTTTTVVSAATVTTFELVPVPSSVIPTTTTSTTTTTTTVPAPTTTTTAPHSLTGAGAALTAPSAASDRVVPAGAGCEALADEGWGSVQCGVAHGGGATLTWLIESRATSASPGLRAYVFRGGTGGVQTPVLEAFDDLGQRFAGIKARVESVAGDGTEQIVFGLHNQGSGQVLSVDLVQGTGVVAAHVDASKGAARLSAGQLDIWSAVFQASEANCCPSMFEHATIRDVSGWKVVARGNVPASQVPPSQL